MYCCSGGRLLQSAFLFCPSCGTKKGETSAETSSTEMDSDNTNSSKRKRPSAGSGLPSFSAYMKQKETERQSHFKPNKKKGRAGETKTRDEIVINVGLMEYEYGEAKIQRGKSFPVKLSKDMGYDEVKEKALKKWEDYDRTFSRDRGYVITYQDGQLAKKIPGSTEEFTLRKYKEGLGKSYSRIYLYLCPATEKKTESDTMPITNWLNEEEAEMEMVFCGSDSDYTDDFNDINKTTTTTLSSESQPSTSTCTTPIPPDQPEGNACPYFSGLSTKTGLSNFHVSYACLPPDPVLTHNAPIIIWKALVIGKILRKMWKILSPNN